MAIPILEYLTNGKSESSDSQTLYVDLPKNEQIYSLMLELRVTNSATVNNARSIFDVVTKIEVVVDGTKTIFSLPSEEASYAAFVCQGGKLPDHRLFDGGGAESRLHLPIYFGRRPFDEDYMLDTGRYRNAQLRITYALDTTYEASGSFTHTISYYRPLERVSPVGVLRTRSVKEETTTAAVQTISHDLPVNYPWYYLFVRVDDVDADINTDLSKVDVNINSGRFHLFDGDADELYYADKLRYNHARGYINQPVVTGQDTVHTFCDWGAPRGYAMVGTGARIVGIDQVAGEQCRITVLTDAGAQATDPIPVLLETVAQNPHSCLTLFDGRREPLPASQFDEARVDYEINAYVMTLTTCVMELVPGAL